MPAPRRTTRRLLAALLVLACLWWLRPEPAPVATGITEVAAVIPAPESDGELSCDVTGLTDDLSPAVDSGGPLAPPVEKTWTPCPLPEVLAHQPAGTLYLDGDLQPLLEEFRYSPGTVWVPKIERVTSGRLYLDGFSRIDLDLQDGRCALGPVIAKASLTGLVHHTGAGTVSVQGCGTHGMVDADGGFFAVIDATPCTFFAVRQDGDLLVRSEPLELSPQPGEELIVDLHLPEWEVTGPGIHLRLEGDVVLVGEVDEQGAAERAGLAAGDEIVAIDGQALAGLDLWEVLDRMQGPADTTLTVTVVRDGEQVEVGLVREP